MENICSDPRGNHLCTNGKDTYHCWNMENSDGCPYCGMRGTTIMGVESFKSSVEKQGKVVTQIIGFASGHKKTYKGVIAATIEQSEFTRFTLVDGRVVYIQTKNVDWFEVIKE